MLRRHRNHHVVGAEEGSLLARLPAHEIGIVRDREVVVDVAGPGLHQPRLVVHHVVVVGGEPAEVRLQVDQRVPRLVELRGVGGVEREARLQQRHPYGVLHGVQHVRMALRFGMRPEVVPRAGHVLHHVGSVRDPLGTDVVRNGVLRARVVWRVVEERHHLGVVLERGVIDLPELAGGDQLREVVAADHRDVVGLACADLRDHLILVLEVRLVDRDAVVLLEAGDDLRIDVLRPVEVVEVAVDLRLDRRGTSAGARGHARRVAVRAGIQERGAAEERRSLQHRAPADPRASSGQGLPEIVVVLRHRASPPSGTGSRSGDGFARNVS